MSLPYVVCAFHTDDDIYTEEARKLRESLERFKLPFHIKTIQKEGRSWNDICRWKPWFIAEMMVLHPNKDVLYLDADAIVLSHPALFDDFDGDLGVYLRPPGDLFASTIYIKNSERGRFLLATWMGHVVENPKACDQPMLQKTVSECWTGGGIVGIPGTYAYKFAESAAVAVIGQYQASRKVRARAGGRPI